MSAGNSNIAKSVHQRLLNIAKEKKRPFNELLQYYCMERFLYRLSKSTYADRFILKGALMFLVWDLSGQSTRPTRDIDFLGKVDNNIDNIRSIIREICEIPVKPDGVLFDSSSISLTRITEDAEYEGVRTRLDGFMGNAHVIIQVDIGFGDIVVPEAKKIEYPVILNFPIPVFNGYSIESTISEKLQAMVKLGVMNSRMKDFYDIRQLSKIFSFDGITLSRAIKSTFLNRSTDVSDDPVIFNEKFREDSQKAAQWKAFIFKTFGQKEHLSFRQVIDDIEIFISPVLRSIHQGAAFEYTWLPGGPWEYVRSILNKK